MLLTVISKCTYGMFSFELQSVRIVSIELKVAFCFREMDELDFQWNSR